MTAHPRQAKLLGFLYSAIRASPYTCASAAERTMPRRSHSRRSCRRVGAARSASEWSSMPPWRGAAAIRRSANCVGARRVRRRERRSRTARAGGLPSRLPKIRLCADGAASAGRARRGRARETTARPSVRSGSRGARRAGACTPSSIGCRACHGAAADRLVEERLPRSSSRDLQVVGAASIECRWASSSVRAELPRGQFGWLD